MARFTVNHRYASGIAVLPDAGAVVEFDEDTAAHINRDSPDTLSPAGDEPAKGRKSKSDPEG